MRATAMLAGTLLRGSGPAMQKVAEASCIGAKLPVAAAVSCYHSSSTACAGVSSCWRTVHSMHMLVVATTQALNQAA
jgi:hypothetical protein